MSISDAIFYKCYIHVDKQFKYTTACFLHSCCIQFVIISFRNLKLSVNLSVIILKMFLIFRINLRKKLFSFNILTIRMFHHKVFYITGNILKMLLFISFFKFIGKLTKIVILAT